MPDMKFTSAGFAAGAATVCSDPAAAVAGCGAAPALCVDEQAFKGALAGFVMNHEVDDVVAFRRRILGVTADIEIQAGAVAEEDIARAAPRDDAPEQVTGHLVG